MFLKKQSESGEAFMVLADMHKGIRLTALNIFEEAAPVLHNSG